MCCLNDSLHKDQLNGRAEEEHAGNQRQNVSVMIGLARIGKNQIRIPMRCGQKDPVIANRPWAKRFHELIYRGER